MGTVVQFKRKAIPTAPLSAKPSTIYEKGGGSSPALYPGAFGAFLDRARRKSKSRTRNVLASLSVSRGAPACDPDPHIAQAQQAARSGPTQRNATSSTVPTLGTGVSGFDAIPPQ